MTDRKDGRRVYTCAVADLVIRREGETVKLLHGPALSLVLHMTVDEAKRLGRALLED